MGTFIFVYLAGAALIVLALLKQRLARVLDEVQGCLLIGWCGQA